MTLIVSRTAVLIAGFEPLTRSRGRLPPTQSKTRAAPSRVVIDAIRAFAYRQPTMAAHSRARQLQRLIGRIERLIAGGAAVSTRFTTYRLAIFITGVICTVTLFRSGLCHSGNLALAGFVSV